MSQSKSWDARSMSRTKWALRQRIWSRKTMINTSDQFSSFFFLEVGKTDWGRLDYTALHKIWVSLISITKWQEMSVNKCHEHILLINFITYYWFTYIFYILIFILKWCCEGLLKKLQIGLCCTQGSSWSFRTGSLATISGRIFGPNVGFPYIFNTFSLLPQLKIGRIQPA